MVPQVSVASYLALLEEPEHELQAHALTKLNDLVDVFWSEIADASTTMYSLFGEGRLMVIVKFCMRIKSFHNGSWRRWYCQRWDELRSALIVRCISTSMNSMKL